MPRQNPFSKKTATTFRLVHRAQNDPLIHDENASSMVFTEVSGPSTAIGTSGSKLPYSSQSGSTLTDLQSEFGDKFRPNEGEAANHGIFFDDSKYDYMQHMRDLGTVGGEVHWIEAIDKMQKGKKAKNMVVELKEEEGVGLDRRSEAGLGAANQTTTAYATHVFAESMLPSEYVQRRTYQDMQDIPDAIAGFQPDMDSRLREVLEALEDDAYIDGEDEAVFAELAEDGAEVDEYEWEATGWEGEQDDGYATDDTIRGSNSSPVKILQSSDPEQGRKFSHATAVLSISAEANSPASHLPHPQSAPAELDDPAQTRWLAEFHKFKSDSATKTFKPFIAAGGSPSLLTTSTALTSGHRKKRKGAQTSTTNYSMTSSALHRTEAMTLLDERFEKVQEEYSNDELGFGDDVSLADDTASMVSGFSKLSTTSSRCPQLTQRQDFDSIMDDFLGGYAKTGKRRVRRGGPQSGLEQLNDIRRGLGPARAQRRVRQTA